MADQTQVTDEQRLDAYAEWLRANKEKAGSPEFVKVADAYRQLRTPAETEKPDPYSFVHTAGRVVSDAVLGIPDLFIKLQNAGLNPLEPGPMRELRQRAQAAGQPGLQTEFAPRVRSAVGIEELPPDASTARRLGEAGLTALVGTGGGGVVGALGRAGTVGEALTGAGSALTRNVAVPIATATAGGKAGEVVSEALGGDRDTGALLGSLAGGVAPSVRGQMAARGARPDAAEIAAAARRQGVTLTPGMVGDPSVQALENSLAGKGGSGGVITRGRNTALDQMRGAVERAIEERQALPAATPETADISNAAQTARAGGSDVSGAVQQRLMERVGPRTPVDTTDLYASLGRILNQTDPGTAAPVVSRMGHLRDMIEQARLRDAAARGGAGDPNATVPLTVPYEQFKDWRTGLGRRMQNLDPVPGRFSGQIYDEATQAMRNAATEAGVHPQEFNLAQDVTRNQMRAADIQEAYDRTLGNVEQAAPGPRRFVQWWQGMTPQEQTAIAGSQQGALSDVARLSRAYNYPTNQTGLSRSLGGQLSDVTGRAVGAAFGSMSDAVGIPSGVGAAAGTFGMTPLNWLRARALQARVPAMAGGPRPMTIDDLIAAMQAANIGATR